MVYAKLVCAKKDAGDWQRATSHQSKFLSQVCLHVGILVLVFLLIYFDFKYQDTIHKFGPMCNTRALNTSA